MGINSAYFTYALNGKIYPRLLKALGVTLNKPRDNRLIVTLRDGQLERFHKQRGDTPPADHLVNLMDLKDGVGEVV